MGDAAQGKPEEPFRHLEIEALVSLDSHRGDIIPKLQGIIRRDNTLEASNAACHVCDRRFSMRFEIEAKGRSESASVFRITMACKHCHWNAVFYGYVHQDGRCGLYPGYLSADLFFSGHRRQEQ
jgi:hypothetical protein